MIVSAMYTKIWERLGLASTSSLFSSSEFLEKINDGYKDFVRLTECLKKFVLMDTVASVTTYNFPSDCLKPVWMGFDDEGLIPVGVHDLDLISPEWIGQTGQPCYYTSDLDGFKRFRLWYTPSTGSGSNATSYLYAVFEEQNTHELLNWDGMTDFVSKGSIENNGLYAIAIFNEVIYVAGDNGKLYQWDGVDTLTSVANELNSQDIHSLCVYQGNLYAGTGTGFRLFKWDGSSAWSEVAEDPTLEDKCYNLVVYNNKLYGTGYPDGRLYEWDGVSAWTLKATHPLSDSISTNSVIVWKNRLYAISYYLTDSTIYYWEPGYTEWQVASDTLIDIALSGLVLFNDTIYLYSIYSGVLYKWDGAGAIVQAAAALDYPDGIYSAVVYNNELYLGTGGTGVKGGRLYKYDGIGELIEVADQYLAASQINQMIVYTVTSYTAVTSFTSWQNNNILLYYSYEPADLMATDEPDIELPFHWALIYYCLWKCFSKDGDFYNEELAEFYKSRYLYLVQKKKELNIVPGMTIVGGGGVKHREDELGPGPYLPLDQYEADQF